MSLNRCATSCILYVNYNILCLILSFDWCQGYREDAGLFLESDTDEQLLLHVPFGTAVRISAIVLQNKGKPDQVRLFWQKWLSETGRPRLRE